MRIMRVLGVLLLTSTVLAPAVTARIVDLPPDGAELNRTHVQFRWDSLSAIVRNAPTPPDGYRLEIVEDDGSDDPFARGDLLTYETDASEPRLVVTEGLAFDTSYAWRVRALGGSTAVGRTSRFSTIPVTEFLPPRQLVVPDGAAPVQPGLTCWTMRRNGLGGGFLFCVEPDGELVLQHLRESGNILDMRMMDNGRLFYAIRENDSLFQLCRWAESVTLDGKTTWSVGDERCDVPQPFPQMGVHHEAFPMPMSAPRGANFMLMEFDNVIVTFEDVHDGNTYVDHRFYGDFVNEYDRHSREIVKSWSTFEAICLDDHLPPEHPLPWGFHPPLADIHHGNAAVYDDLTGRVIVSARRQSRLIVVDWESGETLFQFGEIDSYPGGPPFPCGDVTFGDNLFSTQHAPQPLPNGNMIVYDNGNLIEPLDEPRQSRAVEIAFDDPDDPTDAWIVWEYSLVEGDLVTPSYGRAVGDADRLPNGNTLTNNGMDGHIIEVDPEGNTIWHLTAGVSWPGTDDGDPVTSGTNIYRIEKFPALIVDTAGDTDGDWDLDLLDLVELQTAYAGLAGAELGFPEKLTDHDGNGTLDADDVEAFAYWMTGPGR